VVESTFLCVRTWVEVLCVPFGCYLNCVFLCVFILDACCHDKFLKLWDLS